MRALLWITGILAILYSGYWVVGKTAMQSGAEAAFAGAARQGLFAENAGISVSGFPNRFDLTVTDPHLGDPRTGIEWQAPFMQILTLSYKPWHVIAAFAPTQTIQTPTEAITLTSAKLQASLIVTPNTALTLDRTVLVGNGVEMSSTLGWTLAAETLRLATKTDPTRTNTHEIGLELTRFSPDPALAALMPTLPTVIDRVHLDAFASFSAPIDRFVAETRPELTALSIKEAVFNWGTLQASAKGDLAVVAGMPEGRIDLTVRGWRDLVPLAVNTGAISPEVAPTVTNLMEAFAKSSGDPELLEMPLTFENGRMNLGPFPLGDAPRLN